MTGFRKKGPGSSRGQGGSKGRGSGRGGGRPPYRKGSVSQSRETGGRPDKKSASAGEGKVRLNRFIAQAGICSRREADTLIAAGSVQVNGEVVSEMGYKVGPGDRVVFDGREIRSEKKEYILLNKPKNFITTTSDEKGRRTVMELVSSASSNRLYPVGRLDRNTTGLLLFTNDGDLAKKLTHPRYGVRKIYHVHLDTNLKGSDLEKIRAGLTLDDGPIEVDEVSFIPDRSHREVGIELHSGRNRVVRRIFEHLGYTVTKLDRVVFAGLTKKDLPRGHWRPLTEQEINNLRMIRA